MKLTEENTQALKTLMTSSAEKGNLANAGMVFDKDGVIAQAESLVASDKDATAHSERMLVSKVCKKKENNYTPGLTMLTVVEPCLMCMSACAQAGYKEILYIIPANRYVEKIPWMSDVRKLDKQEVADAFTESIELTHLEEYEEEFISHFEELMADFLN